ncbi:hypothetical protein EMCRGX_G000440 [Ephydatia muelleri]
MVIDTSLIPLRSFASCGWMVTWLPCGGMPLVMPGRPTPKSSKEQRKQTGKFSRHFLRLEKGYLGRHAKFFPLLGLLPTILRLGTCYNKNTPVTLPSEANGRAPIGVAKFLAGGSLTALIKSDEGSPLDIRPIAVGDEQENVSASSEFFGPFQLGVACPAGAEKIDLRNAFNEDQVSRQALLEECATHFLNFFSGGFFGVMDNTPPCGTPWALLDLNIEFSDLDGFPANMKRSHEPNCEILGAPIGDVIFCAKFLAQKRAKAVRLLSQLSEVGALDPQIALLLLRHCASFCKLVHLARSTPPSLVSEGLALFDEEVRRYFTDCVAIDASDSDWLQVQLSLNRGGLGLRKLALHCSAAYLASIIKAGCADPRGEFTMQAITTYNSLVPLSQLSL